MEQDKARLRTAFEAYNMESAFPEIVLTSSKSEQIKLLQGYFDTMLLKDLVEHYRISNIGVVRYFVKRIMANLTKPTSINAIYKDIKSQGLKVSKDDLYLWANYICDIFINEDDGPYRTYQKDCQKHPDAIFQDVVYDVPWPFYLPYRP